MPSAEDERNVNQMLLQFSTMDTYIRNYYLQELLTHLTASEKDFLISCLTTSKNKRKLEETEVLQTKPIDIKPFVQSTSSSIEPPDVKPIDIKPIENGKLTFRHKYCCKKVLL